MLDDDAIDRAGDLPPEVWRFLREKKFLGMIIPREHGGLGFGHFAHAAVVTKIATVNTAAAVTVMVPNSLGPAELLLAYGTEAQQRHYLPRLADGRELPCFALTSPYAGSDAASIPDRGVLTERVIDGRRVRGFVVDFDKRYITLAPVASVVGLAFHAIDPARPQGEQELGMTCALLPVPTEGMSIGSRHRPMNSAFMNGPIRGTQVFVPMDWVIGGEERVGQGWRMLMESLAAGRAISLPALGSALQQVSLYVAVGYGRIREQFGLQISRFQAIAALIAAMAADLYATDAARRYTAAVLDEGERPSVASAILKVQLTEAGRRAVNHGMDILGGKAISYGPKNLLGVAYRHAPIAITVEGANILTRALIIFGPGRGALPSAPAGRDARGAGAGRRSAGQGAGRPCRPHASQSVGQPGAGAGRRHAAAGTGQGGAADRARFGQVCADRGSGDGSARRSAQAHGAAVGAPGRRAVEPLPGLGLHLALPDRGRAEDAADRTRRDPRAARSRRRHAARSLRQPAVAPAALHGAAAAARDPAPGAAARPRPDRAVRRAARGPRPAGAAVSRRRRAGRRRPARPDAGARTGRCSRRRGARAEQGPAPHRFARSGGRPVA
jgi:alkylation response protein AidB-like acyl-CoA dehydrogenase